MKRHLAACLVPLLAACSGNPPTDLGLREQGFKPCPDKPNCVNSYATVESGHAIEPLRPAAGQTLDGLWAALPLVLKDHDIRLVEMTPDYVRAEATTALMRFVDDLEFYRDAAQSVIQVRSASRIGYSDLGKNRSRIEEIRGGLRP